MIGQRFPIERETYKACENERNEEMTSRARAMLFTSFDETNQKKKALVKPARARFPLSKRRG
jgi:hypothetical protein